MLKAVLFISSCFVISLGIRFDDPCYIYTGMRMYNSTDLTRNVTVPENCTNGVFAWHSPYGHVLLIFPNKQVVQTSVCLRGRYHGDILIYTDTTSNSQLSKFNSTHWECTNQSNAHEIVLRVDGPPVPDRYMEYVSYRIQT